jgi:hypothetical protein
LLWRTGGVGVGEDAGGGGHARFNGSGVRNVGSGKKKIDVREMERRGKNGIGKKDGPRGRARERKICVPDLFSTSFFLGVEIRGASATG